METVQISTEAGLQELLRKNGAYANGKNFRLSHLYSTAAQSRFEIENILGIYLARPKFAWMALWMSVTDRSRIRKRHLGYQAPSGDDTIGSLIIGGANGQSQAQYFLRDQAFLYLFDPLSLPPRTIDLSLESSKNRRLAVLSASGYAWQEIQRHGQLRRALVPPSQEPPTLLGLDSWQVVIVQVARLVPTLEIVLSGDLMSALASRVDFQNEMPGSDYLKL